MSTPKLSVVIATLGKSPHLRGLLERLQRQVCTFPYEVLVVSNLPSQSLRLLVQSMRGPFEYLEIGRIGVNLARNKGFERARGEIVVFLDDDTLLDSDSFLQLYWNKHALYQEALAIGGPYQLSPSATVLNQVYDQVTRELIERSRQDSKMNTSQLLGGNLSIKRNMHFEGLSPFDDVILFGEAEAGFCQRLALAGGKLKFLDELAIEHATDLTPFAFCKKAYLRGAGRRWRNDHLAQLPLQFRSEWNMIETQNNNETTTIGWKLSLNLYRLFFDFGYKENPYALSDRLTPLPNINKLRLFVFTLMRVSANTAKKILGFHRYIYASVRAAAINSSPRRTPHALPPLAPNLPDLLPELLPESSLAMNKIQLEPETRQAESTFSKDP